MVDILMDGQFSGHMKQNVKFQSLGDFRSPTMCLVPLVLIFSKELAKSVVSLWFKHSLLIMLFQVFALSLTDIICRHIVDTHTTHIHIWNGQPDLNE